MKIETLHKIHASTLAREAILRNTLYTVYARTRSTYIRNMIYESFEISKQMRTLYMGTWDEWTEAETKAITLLHGWYDNKSFPKTPNYLLHYPPKGLRIEYHVMSDKEIKEALKDSNVDSASLKMD